jgi:hypothetical protein
MDFTDADATNKDVLFVQLVGELMEPGNTILGEQTIKAQFMVKETDSLNNMFLTLGMRVINDNGTVNWTQLDPTRDNVEAQHPGTIYVNRQFVKNTLIGVNYTTVLGDRPVFEIGMGGNPTDGPPAGSHGSGIRLWNIPPPGSSGDLPENDTEQSDTSPYANCWIEIEDTLLFTKWVKVLGKTNLLGKVNVL